VRHAVRAVAERLGSQLITADDRLRREVEPLALAIGPDDPAAGLDD
jgi:hypothetical protein